MQPARTFVVLAAVFTLLSRSVAADTSEAAASHDAVLDRIAALERRFEELSAENRALREQLAALQQPRPAPAQPSTIQPAAQPAKLPPVYVAAAGKEQKVTLGGFMHLNGEAGGTPDARWNGLRDRVLLRRARLNVSGTFKDDVAFKLEGDFGANSISSRSGISAQLTDAYVDWTPHPAAGVRVGQFKSPFGYEQLLADTRTAMVERTLANDRMTLGRQVGVGLQGKLAESRVSYSTALFNGTGTNTSVNDNDNFLWAGRLSAALLRGDKDGFPLKASIGTNVFTTRLDGTFAGTREGLGLDAQFAYGDAALEVEWLRNESDPDAGTSITADGWSALFTLDLTTRWQAALRFETYDSNTAATATESDTWTVGATYRIRGDDLNFTLNYLIGDPPGAVDDDARLLGRLQVQF